ncbi:MAG TPA: phosphate ABC transporter permease subunit PstC [Actinomycetota bacterium]|nr:phosphate ABC transporter permease subunit PstC [Actinomycetota bacterium]
MRIGSEDPALAVTTAPTTHRRTLTGRRPSEGVARGVAMGGALLLLGALGLMIVRLAQLSAPIWKEKGISWVWGSTWAPANGVFGALPFILGTVITSAIALVIATPLGVGTALFISELCPARLRRPVGSVIDLLAAVPSVIYGLWGIYVLLPILLPVERALADSLGRAIPIFSGPIGGNGSGFFAAGVVLAIMILPTISAVSREVMLTIPRDAREAGYALGATRWEMIRMAVLPPARTGIMGALILGLGRALGETVAVLMLIGDVPAVNHSLFASGYSMASVIANEFNEAIEHLHVQALIGIGIVLFLVTVVIDIGARLLVRKAGG